MYRNIHIFSKVTYRKFLNSDIIEYDALLWNKLPNSEDLNDVDKMKFHNILDQVPLFLQDHSKLLVFSQSISTPFLINNQI